VQSDKGTRDGKTPMEFFGQFDLRVSVLFFPFPLSSPAIPSLYLVAVCLLSF